jgi:endonuclease-3
MSLPPNFKLLYGEIKKHRNAHRNAPVDSIGCSKLYDLDAAETTKRYQILTSLQLSSQTKDQVTAQAIENLKNGLPGGLTPNSVVAVTPAQLNSLISKVGFHNRKTEYLRQTAAILVDQYEGDIPRTLEDMLKLPGFGPKMAYLCMQEAWKDVVGIGVDTHVHRISQRLGWTTKKCKIAEDTRKELEAWLPRDQWGEINELLVGWGQTICKPIGPICDECPVSYACPKIDVIPSAKKKKSVGLNDGTPSRKKKIKIEYEDIDLSSKKKEAEIKIEAEIKKEAEIKTEAGLEESFPSRKSPRLIKVKHNDAAERARYESI